MHTNRKLSFEAITLCIHFFNYCSFEFVASEIKLTKLKSFWASIFIYFGIYLANLASAEESLHCNIFQSSKPVSLD